MLRLVGLALTEPVLRKRNIKCKIKVMKQDFIACVGFCSRELGWMMLGMSRLFHSNYEARKFLVRIRRGSSFLS